MRTVTADPAKLSLPQAVQTLSAQLQKAKLSNGALGRFEVEIKGIPPLKWLQAQNSESKFFWQDRDKNLTFAAIGCADLIVDNNAVQRIEKKLLENSAGLRYFGGLAFDPARTPGPEWSKFKKARFILPRVEVSERSGHFFLACQTRLASDEIKTTITALSSLQNDLDIDHEPLSLPENRLDTPSHLLWERYITQILKAIEDHTCDKTVLARQVKLQFPRPISAAALLSQLNEMTSNCFCFLFQLSKTNAFLGASPERLYCRAKRRLETEAVAGTRPKVDARTEDAQFQKSLQNSQKERREQKFVIDAIEDGLLTLCAEFNHDEVPSLLNWSGGHHLITRFRGELRTDVPDSAVLSTLHPTPAVAGTPKEKALELISRLETFDRGWYAGPVGYLSRESSEFAVAIRSGLISGNDLFLYAGAGIVEGSLPKSEWAETEHKLLNFLKIFDVPK